MEIEDEIIYAIRKSDIADRILWLTGDRPTSEEVDAVCEKLNIGAAIDLADIVEAALNLQA